MPYADPDDRRASQRDYYRRNERQKELRRGATQRYQRRERERILERDNYTCVYCGTCYRDEPHKLVRDHKTPILRKRFEDGRRKPTQPNNDDANLITACTPCNQKKGAKSYERFMAEMHPDREPEWVIDENRDYRRALVRALCARVRIAS